MTDRNGKAFCNQLFYHLGPLQDHVSMPVYPGWDALNNDYHEFGPPRLK